MTVRNDKELTNHIRDLGYVCMRVYEDGQPWIDATLAAYEKIVAYIDKHYAPKPDLTEMTCVSVLEDALTAIRRYEDWHSKEWMCFWDVELRILAAIEELGGNDV